MFNKILEISILFDFYGKLLNEKQASIIDLYYNQDLSLAEIAEHFNISRQGVYDYLKRAESKLFEYERKLGLVKKFNMYDKSVKNILKYTSMIKDSKYERIIYSIEREAKLILCEVQEENCDF